MLGEREGCAQVRMHQELYLPPDRLGYHSGGQAKYDNVMYSVRAA